MKSETVKTVILVSTLGLIGHLIYRKLKENKEIVKGFKKELVITMEPIFI